MSNEEHPVENQPAPAPPHTGDDNDFLIPGPTPTSNKGCFTWGASWVIVSLVLLVIIAAMTVVCFFISLLMGLL